jgi:hypothetical protein
MAKKSALEKAIEQLEGEIAVLQAAVARLRQQQAEAQAKKAPTTEA